MANEASVVIKKASEMTARTPKTVKKTTFASSPFQLGKMQLLFLGGVNFTEILSFAT